MTTTITAAAVAVLFMAGMVCHAAEPESVQKDIQTIRERLVERFLEKEAVDVAEVQKLISDLKPDGHWQGVDYKSRRTTNWPVFFHHFTPVSKLVRAYYAPDSPLRNNAELKKAMLNSLNCWLTKDWKNPNGYYNTVGGPRILGPVLLAVEAELTPEQRKKGIEILKRATLSGTGANLLWHAEVVFVRGLLESNADLVRQVLRRAEGETKLTDREGIQHDWSYHFHGNTLYSLGYGDGFLRTVLRFAVLTRDTSFALHPKCVERISNAVLDGCQWMVYGPALDLGSNGRQITRGEKVGRNSGGLLLTLRKLKLLPTGRAKEIEALIAHLTDHTKAPPKEGNRHFWCSDFMSHKRKGYYASARNYSTRVFNTDAPCNGEALKSHYIADGCNFLMITGKEYDKMMPVWDWQKIPGTTVVQDRNYKGRTQFRGKTSFVGGVSDGTYGMSAVDFKRRNGLQARKSWFFFDDEYVCLGAGITSAVPSEVVTTIQQCELIGDVTVEDANGKRTLDRQAHTLSGPLAVHHQGVTYMIPGDASVVLKNVTTEGRWRSINKNDYAKQNKAVCDVFSLWIAHGKAPKNADYAYIVVPGGRKAALHAELPVEILSNTSELQAVRHPQLGITQVAFYTAGTLRSEKDSLVSANQPCLVMLRKAEDGLAVTVADPTQKLKDVQLTLPGQCEGEGCSYDSNTKQTTVTVKLPTGGYAGKSVERALKTQ